MDVYKILLQHIPRGSFTSYYNITLYSLEFILNFLDLCAGINPALKVLTPSGEKERISAVGVMSRSHKNNLRLLGVIFRLVAATFQVKVSTKTAFY